MPLTRKAFLFSVIIFLIAVTVLLATPTAPSVSAQNSPPAGFQRIPVKASPIIAGCAGFTDAANKVWTDPSFHDSKAAASGSVVVISQLMEEFALGSLADDFEFFQSFVIPPGVASVDGVTVKLAKFGPLVGDITLQVYRLSDNTSALQGPVLRESKIKDDALPAGAYTNSYPEVTFTFDSLPVVSSGLYSFRLTYASVSFSSWIQFKHSTDLYPDGMFWFGRQQPHQDIDLYFKIFGSVAPPITLGEQAAALAMTLLTTPYGYGGKGYDFQVKSYVDAPKIFGSYNYYLSDCTTATPLGLRFAKGVDCSGLVMWSYNTAFGATKDFDDNLNPIQYQTANGQYLENTKDVNEADLKPGDLLFFNYEHGKDPKTGLPKAADHVAMYVGGDDVLEAYTCNPKYPTGNYVIRSSRSTRASRDPITGQSLVKCGSGVIVPCFVGFRTLDAPKVKLGIYPASPITLAVTDPDGFTITADAFSFTDREVFREVADVLYYNDSDAVISPVLKTGAYLIRILPKPGTNSADTYGLVVKVAGSTITLAQNVPIRDIPTLGYGIESSGSTILPFVPIALDIQPGGFPNTINPNKQGKIPVAILSSSDFSALSEVDTQSLKVGRTGDEPTLASCNSRGEDVNGDGLLDLVCNFYAQKTGFQVTDTQAILKGRTISGRLIRGVDSVRIVLLGMSIEQHHKCDATRQ